MIQSVQEDQNLVWQPTDDEHGQNNKNKVCSLPFHTAPAAFPHLLAALKDFSDAVTAVGDNGNWEKEAYNADSHVVAQPPSIVGIGHVACFDAQIREELDGAEEDSREAE